MISKKIIKLNGYWLLAIGLWFSTLPTANSQTLTAKSDETGRTRIVLNSLIYGAALYGPGTISLLNLEGTRLAGLEMIISSGAFAAGIMTTRNYDLGETQTELLTWGAYAGTAYGLGSLVFFDTESTRGWAIPAMITTPISAMIAHKLTSDRQFGKGESDLIIRSGIVGAIYGSTFPLLIPQIENLTDQKIARIHVATAMAITPLAIWTATRLIDHVNIRDFSVGNAELLTFGAIFGTAYGGGIADLIFHNRYMRLHLLSAMIGCPIGIYSAYRWTTQENYSISRSRMIAIGAIAGTIFSEGIMLLTGVEHRRFYVASAILGSAVGIYIAHGETKSEENGAGKSPSAPIKNFVFSAPLLTLRF